MLKVTENTATKLVLKDQNQLGGLIAGVFTVFSGISVLLTIAQGIEAFTLRLQNEGHLAPLQVATFLMFVAFGMAFTAILTATTFHFGRGVIFILDKTNEVMSLQRMGLFRMKHITHSIYGISHVDVEQNTDVQAYGLWLVLRSGERIPLGAISMLDEDHMETLLKQIRSFLRA